MCPVVMEVSKQTEGITRFAQLVEKQVKGSIKLVQNA